MPYAWRIALIVAVILVIAGLTAFVLAARTSRSVPSRPPGTPDALPPCPDSPNCVCSCTVAEDAGHYVEPLPLDGESGDVIRWLRTIVESLPHATVLREEPGYLHAEIATPWFGFRDDLEFLVDEQAGVVHVRSASRVGHSDLGVNRDRVERIRADLLNLAE